MIPDTGLPIEAAIAPLRSALAQHRSAVLIAPPGSGKTTVVPLRLVDEFDGRIVVLEPRRVATRAAARRMAHLAGDEVGGLVGYVTRDDRRTSRSTRIEVVTEGVLTRRIQNDPELPGVSLVVFDEVHERNLQTDLGLALTLDARRVLRPNLAILAMSATIDADRIADLIGGPVVAAEAGMHPVEIRYAPPKRGRLEDHAAATIRRALDKEPGDILAFLPGMAEIRRVRDRLGDVFADVHILHGSLSAADQDAAITPGALRKVVLSTDIAESSLTVEGIRVVIDAGLARNPRQDSRTGMTRLHTGPASRASADQRAGRAGRIEPGVAYRLWSKMEHAGRRPHIEPEITQVDLAGFVLECAAWGTPIDELSWLDDPPQRSVRDASSLVHSLGALDDEGRITATGRAMARLPLHPRLARMVVDAGDDVRLACAVAALADGRGIVRGHPNDVPVDLAERVRILEGETRHPASDRRGVDRARRDADDLVKRVGGSGPIDPDRTGRVLALAYPDRLAVRRGSPGRFQLRTGTTAWMPDTDPLSTERYIVAADLDGRRKDARIRLAAGIDEADMIERFSHEIDERRELVWEGRRLIDRRDVRLGGLSLSTHETRPDPGPATTQAIVDRIARDGIARLAWTKATRSLRSRVCHLHRRFADPWPDLGDDALLATLDTWLAHQLTGATGLDDVDRLDLHRAIRSIIPPHLFADLERLAPTHVTIPSGRRLPLDYDADRPGISVRVQEMFGTNATPQVAGVPVVLTLLSPANRPVQITSDLAGFWAGSWAEVRKEMAGRYPKHDWPVDPATARPTRR